MAVKKIGINGFGRIGRYLVRLLADSNDLEVAVINARADNAGLAHLLKYDSTHGHFPYPVEACEEGIIVNGKTIKVTRDPLGEWKWGELGIDLVIETTGKMKDKTAAMDHIKCGAKKVIVSAPTKEADATIVMGVNDSDYDVAAHQVISAASCTTNCLAPATKVIDEKLRHRERSHDHDPLIYHEPAHFRRFPQRFAPSKILRRFHDPDFNRSRPRHRSCLSEAQRQNRRYGYPCSDT